MAQLRVLLTRPPRRPTASFLGTSTDGRYHQHGDENETTTAATSTTTKGGGHTQLERVEAQADGDPRQPAATNTRLPPEGSALSKTSSSAQAYGPDSHEQPSRPQLAQREPDAVHGERNLSQAAFPRSSSGPQHYASSGPIGYQRAAPTPTATPTAAANPHATNTTVPTNANNTASAAAAATATMPMASATAGSSASRSPLQSRPPSSSVPTLDSLPPIQPLQDPDDDDQLHDFPFNQFPTYNAGRGWLPFSGTYPHSSSTEAAFSATSQPANMSRQPPQLPAGPSRLPGAHSLENPRPPPSFPASSSQSQSQSQSQGQNHYGYPSHGSGNTSREPASHASHVGVGVGILYRQPPASEPVQHSSHLPSMRTIDVQQPPSLPPPPHGLALPGPQMMQPAPPPPYVSMLPPPYSMPPHALPIYGLPGQSREYHSYRMPPPGMSSIPRHKKEIKRRTKTGCMTCRKRRIKCDETHPTCNNCRKSKRECAGYDPVFRQQPQSSGTLQTATHPSGPASSSSTTTYAAGASASVSITPTAAAAVAAAAAAAASTASTLAAVRSVSATVAPSPVSSSSSTPTSTPSFYTVTGTSAPASSSSSSLNISTAASSNSTAYNPKAYTSRSILSPNQDWGYAPDSSGFVYRAKMKVDDIIGLAGPAPPAPTMQPTLETLDDITKMYFEIYVPGLTTFFETTWYNFKSNGTVNPVSNLLNNKNLVGLLSAFLSSIARVETADASDANMIAASALETRIVWALAAMAYVTPATVNLPSEEPLATDNAIEARNRLSVIDALLSGGCVRTNPCMPPPRGGNPARIREHQFWWWLAEYLRLQEDAGLNNTPGNSLPRLREQALARMRNLLDGRENRDIIYSIAILRHLAPRYSSSSEMIVPPGHEDEADPHIKFAMATEFIRKQAQDHGAGLTNVGRRIAEIGLKAFVQPGYSIRRA